MRSLNETKHDWEGDSLRKWYKIKNPFRVTINFILIYIARYLPSLWLKRVLYRLIGVRIGKSSVGLGAVFDVFFPEMISIGDNSIIGYNTTILCHEFLVDSWKTGEVKIGNNVMIGANVTILPGISIGDGATISAMSLVNKDVEPGKKVGGVPIKVLHD